jgi:hypothetical protein
MHEQVLDSDATCLRAGKEESETFIHNHLVVQAEKLIGQQNG